MNSFLKVDEKEPKTLRIKKKSATSVHSSFKMESNVFKRKFEVNDIAISNIIL